MGFCWRRRSVSQSCTAASSARRSSSSDSLRGEPGVWPSRFWRSIRWAACRRPSLRNAWTSSSCTGGQPASTVQKGAFLRTSTNGRRQVADSSDDKWHWMFAKASHCDTTAQLWIRPSLQALSPAGKHIGGSIPVRLCEARQGLFRILRGRSWWCLLSCQKYGAAHTTASFYRMLLQLLLRGQSSPEKLACRCACSEAPRIVGVRHCHTTSLHATAAAGFRSSHRQRSLCSTIDWRFVRDRKFKDWSRWQEIRNRLNHLNWASHLLVGNVWCTPRNFDV